MGSREQAVQLLNDAKLASDSNQKVQSLRGLREVIIMKEPALLPEFMETLVELQVEPTAAVRKFLAELLADAAAALPRPAVLTPAAVALAALAADTAAAVAKAAVSAAVVVFRTAFAIVAHQGAKPQPGPDMAGLWGAADRLRAAVTGLLAGGGRASDGVRLQAARFTEQAVLLYTADAKPPPPPGAASLAGPPGPLTADHKLLKPSQLTADAGASVTAIATLLRAPGVDQLSGPLRIVAVKAAGSLAVQRPRLLARLLPPLLALAKSTASQGGSVAAASAAKAVGEALAGVARGQAAEAVAWRPKLQAALSALGAAGDAGAAAAADRLQRSSDAQLRRPPDTAQGAAKRIKLEPPATNGHAAAAAPQQPPQQQQQQQPGSQVMPPPGELAQAQYVLGALVGRNDPPLLDAYLQSLAPGLLADIVIANMGRLPPAPPADASATGQGALAGLMQGLSPQQPAPQHAAAQPQQQQPHQPAAQLQQQRPQAAAHGPMAAAGPAHAKAEGPEVPPAVIRIPTVPQFALRPADMPPSARAAVRRAAVARILAAGGGGLEPVRDAALAHLVTQGPGEDPAAAEVVSQLLADYDRPGAHEFALAWLNTLFAARAGGQTGGSAHAANQPAQADEAERVGSAADGGAADGAAQGKGGPAAGGQNGTSGVAADGAQPSAYESVLIALLEGLRQKREAKDAALMRLLLEAPWLPAPAVPAFLAATIELGPEWTTAAMSCANNLVLLRPPDRAVALGVLLEAAVAADGGVHSKAVRLLANRLFGQPVATAAVEAFARTQLDLLLAPATDASNSGNAAPTGAVAGEDPAPARVKAEGDAGRASAARAVEPLAAPAAAQTGQPAALPPTAAGGSGSGRGEPAEAEVLAAARRCGLYCALCTKRHSLLPRLLEVFAGASPAGQTAIMRNAPGLARTIGAQAPQLLALVAEFPAGSEKLLLHMLHVLTDSAPPPQPLVAAALERYDQSKDVRWAVPVLAGVPQQRVPQLLPPAAATCATGDTATFDAGVQRLLMARPGAGGAPQLTPTQLLVGLHSIAPSPSSVPLRALMAALGACLAARDAFPAEAAASALGQLVARQPLPPLFMRFVMQAGAAWPRLKPFVLELLVSLIGKQVWNDTAQWKGWLLAAEQAGPPAYPALLSLPPSVLARALASMRQGAALRPKLAAFAAAPDCRVTVSLDTLRVLQGESAD